MFPGKIFTKTQVIRFEVNESSSLPLCTRRSSVNGASDETILTIHWQAANLPKINVWCSDNLLSYVT